jgi:hypothetical protein
MATAYHPEIMNWAHNMEKARRKGELLKAIDASRRSQEQAKQLNHRHDLQQQAEAARLAGA